MTIITRRALVGSVTALAAAGALTGPALLDWAKAWAQTAPWKPEKGAALSLLRWTYFVQSEDDAFVKLTDAFTQATGVKVNIARESYEDVQPKASVAANTGAGPDLFWGLYSLPHLFPQKCLDVTDVADYLGKKYGGWVPSAVTYGQGTGNKWIAIPICYAGNLLNYRVEASKKAGFSTFPATTDELLAYAKAMKAQGTPGGMALGHASGDGNAWVYWCLWTFGGNMVDVKDPELDQLTTREREVLRHIARGFTYKEVALRLHLSVKTVETHVSSVLRKLQLSNRHELQRWAADRRMV